MENIIITIKDIEDIEKYEETSLGKEKLTTNTIVILKKHLDLFKYCNIVKYLEINKEKENERN
jgi:hypothetical protein